MGLFDWDDESGGGLFADPRKLMLAQLAGSLMEASGPQPVGTSTASVLGRGMQRALPLGVQATAAGAMNQIRGMQVKKMRREEQATQRQSEARQRLTGAWQPQTADAAGGAPNQGGGLFNLPPGVNPADLAEGYPGAFAELMKGMVKGEDTKFVQPGSIPTKGGRSVGEPIGEKERKPPQHRRVIRGGQEIDQEYDQAKGWYDIGGGPRFKPGGEGGPEPLQQVYDPDSPTGSRFVPRSQAVGAAGPKAPLSETEEERSFKRTNTLRDEFDTKTKDFRTVQDAYSKIKSTSPTGAGDMSMLYQYVKLLDPGSVVRESEFATAAASGSFGERVQGAVQRVMTGQRMAPELRQSFLSEADRVYKGQKQGYDRMKNRYQGLSKSYGLKPEQVITDYSEESDQPSGGRFKYLGKEKPDISGQGGKSDLGGGPVGDTLQDIGTAQARSDPDPFTSGMTNIARAYRSTGVMPFPRDESGQPDIEYMDRMRDKYRQTDYFDRQTRQRFKYMGDGRIEPQVMIKGRPHVRSPDQ